MDDDMPPWEPPFAGSEVEHLLGSLNRLRATFRWKASGLDAAGLSHRLPGVSITLGGLLKHLAWAEALMFRIKLDGAPIGEPWQSVDFRANPDWEFVSAADDTPERLYALWDTAVLWSTARLAEAIADGGLDQPVAWGGPDFHVTLRRMLFDLVEEYGRHTGHADLLRESWDGLTGEDPPVDFPWPPR